MSEEQDPNKKNKTETNWIGSIGCLLGVVLILVLLTILGIAGYIIFGKAPEE